MYKEHSSFRSPSDEAILWRHMDFTKFASLLETQSLFFARTDKLGDPFEGSFSKKNQSLRDVQFSKSFKTSEERSEFMASYSILRKALPMLSFVNCWHENEHESEAMWKIYGRESGIAVKSTFKKLCCCFICDQDVRIGRVNYVDYDKVPISEHNIYVSLLTKRESFKHEQEVRAIVTDFRPMDYPIDENSLLLNLQMKGESGLYLRVDITTLVEEVVVAPGSPEWFLNLVKSLSKRYDLLAPVIESRLDAEPFW